MCGCWTCKANSNLRPCHRKERKEKKNYAGSKTLPASIKEKETHWPKVPWVSPTKMSCHKLKSGAGDGKRSAPIRVLLQSVLLYLRKILITWQKNKRRDNGCIAATWSREGASLVFLYQVYKCTLRLPAGMHTFLSKSTCTYLLQFLQLSLTHRLL